MFCSKCGAPVDDSAVFCSECGNKLTNYNKEDKSSDFTAAKEQHNPISKFIFITIALQIVLVILSGRPGTLGGAAIITALALSIVVLVLSILTVIKSKKYNKKGKILGIVFTVLSSMLILIMSLAIVFSVFDKNVTDNNSQYINDNINVAAINSIGKLKDSLKDPSSLKINKIYAKVYDTRISVQYSDGTYNDGGDFKGYFDIYIDYTANNGFGGVNRGCFYFRYDQDMIPKKTNKVDSMPTVDDTVIVLDTNKYNKLAENMVLN